MSTATFVVKYLQVMRLAFDIVAGHVDLLRTKLIAFCKCFAKIEFHWPV